MKSISERVEDSAPGEAHDEFSEGTLKKKIEEIKKNSEKSSGRSSTKEISGGFCGRITEGSTGCQNGGSSSRNIYWRNPRGMLLKTSGELSE